MLIPLSAVMNRYNFTASTGFFIKIVCCVYFTVQAEKEEAGEMVDLGLLTDDQLKAKLLQYGVKAGPILGQSVEVTVVWLLKWVMQ